jgi:hypothetical protein
VVGMTRRNIRRNALLAMVVRASSALQDLARRSGLREQTKPDRRKKSETQACPECNNRKKGSCNGRTVPSSSAGELFPGRKARKQCDKITKNAAIPRNPFCCC